MRRTGQNSIAVIATVIIAALLLLLLLLSLLLSAALTMITADAGVADSVASTTLSAAAPSYHSLVRFYAVV